VGTPTYAYLFGTNYFNQVDGFQVVTAVARAGATGTASLYGTGVGDVFRFGGTYAYLFNTGFFNQADGFTFYYSPTVGLLRNT
jgi:hypothetical protein